MSLFDSLSLESLLVMNLRKPLRGFATLLRLDSVRLKQKGVPTFSPQILLILAS